MAYTGYKIYLNRRRLILDNNGTIYYNGLTWSSDLTEPNSDINGNPIFTGIGPYFPPVYDDISCPTISIINWSYLISGNSGDFEIKVNGIVVVSVSSSDSGIIYPAMGDHIEITVNGYFSNPMLSRSTISVDNNGSNIHSSFSDSALPYEYPNSSTNYFDYYVGVTGTIYGESSSEIIE